MNGYARLAGEKPRTVRDHTDLWNRLTPIGSASDDVRAAIGRFCESKRIAFAALEQLGTRTVRRDIGQCLAYAGSNGNGKVVAIKYRPLNGTSHDSVAEAPSVWLRPIVIGKLDSLDWLIAEGETDAARLYGLVGDSCAILALPTGTHVFKREWADAIPRGATVGLCHDADEDGDAGAKKAAEVIGGRTFRIRPPIEGDWCDWDGDRDAFLRLAREDRGGYRLEVLTAREVCALPEPPGDDQVLGPLFVRGQRTVIGAHTGHGKTSLILQAIAAITERRACLDWHGTGGRALVIDAEQGLRTIKRRLREAGLDQSELVDYVRAPDGLELDSNPEHIAAVERILANEYAVLFADPLYKLHRGASNDEREVVDFMRQLDAWRERHYFALALAGHCRKPPIGAKFTMHEFFGSSAYLRGAEIVIGLQRLSDGYAKLHFFKDRDGDLPAIGTHWGLLFNRDEGFRRDASSTEPKRTTKELMHEALAAGAHLTADELASVADCKPDTVRKNAAEMAHIDSYPGPHGKLTYFLQEAE